MSVKATNISRRKTRLLCPDCDELSRIEAHSDEQRLAVLACGHVRTLGLLPAAPGAVSLKNILVNDALAALWFPFAFSENRANLLSEQAVRETWE